MIHSKKYNPMLLQKKYRCCTFILIAAFIVFPFIGNAQQGNPTPVCVDTAIAGIAEGIKNLALSKGFVLAREAPMAMESQYEQPVIMDLKEGSWYQFVFIGDPTSRLFETRLYDWNEKQVVYEKKISGDRDAHIISFSYMPKFSEYYMLKPLQVNKKKKKMCGYLLLFKRVS
jgi:hypothetical protein